MLKFWLWKLNLAVKAYIFSFPKRIFFGMRFLLMEVVVKKINLNSYPKTIIYLDCDIWCSPKQPDKTMSATTTHEKTLTTFCFFLNIIVKCFYRGTVSNWRCKKMQLISLRSHRNGNATVQSTMLFLMLFRVTYLEQSQ